LRYRRHAVGREGKTLVVQFDSQGRSGEDALRGALRQIRGFGASNPAGLLEVVAKRGAGGEVSVELRFSAAVSFSLRASARQLSVLVDRPADSLSQAPPAPSYAVQLHAAPASERVPRLGDASVPEDAAIYTVPFVRAGEPWTRLRVGFFESVEEASEARDVLSTRFPDAWVTPVDPAERVAAANLRGEVEGRGTGRALRKSQPRPAGETRGAVAPNAVAISPDPEVRGWLAAGRRELKAGQLEAAIASLTKVASRADDLLAPEAKELLAIAHERNGQLAHAKAEYEEYLERYPGHAGAARVRQRYEALISAAEPAREPLPRGSLSQRNRYELSGTVATVYLLERRQLDGTAPQTTQSALENDVFLNGRGRVGELDLRAGLAGSFRADLLGGRRTEGRLRTAFVELGERGGRWEAMVGRRSPSGGGVVQRYDGFGVRYGLPMGVGVSVTAGFPVRFGDPLRVHTDRFFAGVAVDLEFARSVFVEIFGAYYGAEGFVDRVGVGGEVRYFQDGLSLSGLVDFDAYHRRLNIAFGSASWQLSPSTGVHGLVDHRASPLLLTRNALIGEGFSRLRRLPLSRKQIERLARDRTASSTLVSVGVNHRTEGDLFLSGEVGVSDFGEADLGGGVGEVLSLGPEYLVSAQLLANDLLFDGSVSSLSARYQWGETSNRLAFLFDGRSPAIAGFRLGPQLLLDYRVVGASKTVGVEPVIVAEYGDRGLRADARLQYRWRSELGRSEVGDEKGLFFSLGLWLNF